MSENILCYNKSTQQQFKKNPENQQKFMFYSGNFCGILEFCVTYQEYLYNIITTPSLPLKPR